MHSTYKPRILYAFVPVFSREKYAESTKQGRSVPNSVQLVDIPPIRSEHNQQDQEDGRRVEFANTLWESQDEPLIERDRQVEENVRMLVGKQWSVWHPTLRRFVDVNEWLSKSGRRHAQRPVVNYLAYIYVINHARMTENPPVIGFTPANSDETSIELAATMDMLSKSLWHDLGMVDVYSRMFGWEYVGGRAYIKVRVDPQKGDVDEYYGPAVVSDPQTGRERPITGPDGSLAQVPFGPNDDGEMVPQVEFDPQTGTAKVTGEAWREHEGGLVLDVLSPLEVRGEWGHQTPWHQKSWHMHETYLTPADIMTRWGVEVQADSDPETDGAGELERMLRGSGFFGAADTQRGNSSFFDHATGSPEGLVRVRELYIRPGSMDTPDRTDDDPGGRLLIVAADQGTVLHDDTRPAPFPYTSGIHAYDFMSAPGRPHGTSPLEFMNPLQRLYNRVWAQLLEHQNLVTNPKIIIDSQTGLREGQITNEPAQILKVNRRPGVPALEYASPPRLSEDPYRVLQLLRREMEDLGNVAGASGRVPQPDDNSGALIRELRFNSDRYLGSPLRNAAEETGRLWESVMAVLSTLWDTEKLIHWTGEDNILRTIVVSPELWEGKVHVKPDLESMLPESRQERQERLTQMFGMGVFGNPEDPEAIRRFAENARFPHLDVTTTPGGPDAETARFVMGRLANGDSFQQHRIYPWYNLPVWIAEFERFMSGREWLKFEEDVKQNFVLMYEKMRLAEAKKALQEAERQASLSSEAEAATIQAQLASGGPQMQAAAEQALAPTAVGPDGQPVQGPPSPQEGTNVRTAGQK